MDKVIPDSKIQCYLILLKCHLSRYLWCQQKQSMTEGWTGGQTMEEMILTLVTHNNNNDITFSIWIDFVWRSRSRQAVYRSRSRTVTQLSKKCMSDVIQMPATAGRISNRVAMITLCGLLRILLCVAMITLCGLLRILLCFELVPPPNLLLFTFVYVLPRLPPFFLRVTCYRARYFFSVGKFLSDIWSGTLAFFVGHIEKLSDCPTSPTNFNSTAL